MIQEGADQRGCYNTRTDPFIPWPLYSLLPCWLRVHEEHLPGEFPAERSKRFERHAQRYRYKVAGVSLRRTPSFLWRRRIGYPASARVSAQGRWTFNPFGSREPTGGIL